MLTAMAIVHQAEHQLPPERVRLYKLLVDVLLRRWQQRKTGEARLAPSDALDRFLKDELRLRAAVERLAYEAHRLGRERDKTADLGRGQALTLLEDPALLGNPGLAGEFLDYVDQRAGLLVGQGGDPARPTAYAFPHRTIQEYLAGCYLAGQREAGRTYYEHAGEGDTWSLAALYGAEELHYNRLNTNGMLDLAYRLCPASEPEDARDWRGLVWSGQMAALAGRETIERDAATGGDKTYLVRLLPRLVSALAGPLPPVERAEAGSVLARLGDLRLEVTEVDEMQLCFVPAGPFLMGSNKDKKDPDSEYDGGPQLQLDQPLYYIGRHPVTQAQFAAFAGAGGYDEPSYWREAAAADVWREGKVRRRVFQQTEAGFKEVEEVADCPHDFGASFSLPNHPIVGITWYEMLAFTRWLTARWQSRGFLPRDWRVSLPSEPEWEKAARGGLQIPAQPMVTAVRQGLGSGTPEVARAENPDPRRAYPWIGAFSANLANIGETGIGTTSAVGCFPAGASPYAVQDLAGNVWEWTRSLYGDYPYPAGGKEREKRENLGGSTAVTRVLRGGAFRGRRWLARCACRSWLLPDYWNDYVGFRVVVSPIRL